MRFEKIILGGGGVQYQRVYFLPSCLTNASARATATAAAAERTKRDQYLPWASEHPDLRLCRLRLYVPPLWPAFF